MKNHEFIPYVNKKLHYLKCKKCKMSYFRTGASFVISFATNKDYSNKDLYEMEKMTCDEIIMYTTL